MKKGKITDREKRLLEKGYKKKKDGILFYKEFELREIADLLVTDPEDVPLNYLPWTDISKEMVSSGVKFSRRSPRLLGNQQDQLDPMMTARMSGRI